MSNSIDMAAKQFRFALDQLTDAGEVDPTFRPGSRRQLLQDALVNAEEGVALLRCALEDE